MREMLPALTFGLLGFIALAAVQLSPREGRPAIIVMAPDRAADRAVASVIDAGWLPVRSLHPFIVLAAPGEPGMSPRRPVGTLLILDATGLRGCS